MSSNEDITDKLININTSEYLLSIIGRVKKARDGESLQLMLQALSTLGVPLYGTFKQEIEDIILTQNSDKHYFNLVKSEVIYAISLAIKSLSSDRKKFEKAIIDKRFEVEKESAKAPIKI